MSTFEGPMMSIKTVNALSHYTDWTIGHVHSGALGWVAFISIGAMYYLIPRLFHRELYSMKLVETHFWIATIGIVLYITSMWISGIMQGLMWRAVNPDGTLTYSFVESVQAMPPRLHRASGGRCDLPQRHVPDGLQHMAHRAFGATCRRHRCRADGLRSR